MPRPCGHGLLCPDAFRGAPRCPFRHCAEHPADQPLALRVLQSIDGGPEAFASVREAFFERHFRTLEARRGAVRAHQDRQTRAHVLHLHDPAQVDGAATRLCALVALRRLSAVDDLSAPLVGCFAPCLGEAEARRVVAANLRILTAPEGEFARLDAALQDAPLAADEVAVLEAAFREAAGGDAKKRRSEEEEEAAYLAAVAECVVEYRPPDPSLECLVCEDGPRDHMCAPCGHLVACAACVDRFAPDAPCPTCRAEVTCRVRVRSPVLRRPLPPPPPRLR
jgi:hypothetical protein